MGVYRLTILCSSWFLLSGLTVACWLVGPEDTEGGEAQSTESKPSAASPARVVPAEVVGSMPGCVLFENGSVSCWGEPPAIEGIARRVDVYGDFLEISIERHVFCGMLKDRTVKCVNFHPLVGSHSSGGSYTLEDGNFIEADLAKNDELNVEGPFKSVDVGEGFACGALTDGQTVCWPIGTGVDTLKAAQHERKYLDTSTAESVSVGRNVACVIKSGGAIECWNLDEANKRDGSEDIIENIPDDRFSEVAVGVAHACGKNYEGSIECWGRGIHNAVDRDRLEFRQSIPSVTTGEQLVVGDAHGCVLAEDGCVSCWGLGYTVSSMSSDENGSGHDTEQERQMNEMCGNDEIDHIAGVRFDGVSAAHVITCGLDVERAKVWCWGPPHARHSEWDYEFEL